MKKRKGKKKTDDIRVFEATYLAAINSNLELTRENKALADELKKFRSKKHPVLKSKSY